MAFAPELAGYIAAGVMGITAGVPIAIKGTKLLVAFLPLGGVARELFTEKVHDQICSRNMKPIATRLDNGDKLFAELRVEIRENHRQVMDVLLQRHRPKG